MPGGVLGGRGRRLQQAGGGEEAERDGIVSVARTFHGCSLSKWTVRAPKLRRAARSVDVQPDKARVRSSTGKRREDKRVCKISRVGLLWNYRDVVLIAVVAVLATLLAQSALLLYRRRSQRRRTHAFFQRVIDGLPDAFYVKDAGSRYVMVNQAFAARARLRARAESSARLRRRCSAPTRRSDREGSRRAAGGAGQQGAGDPAPGDGRGIFPRGDQAPRGGRGRRAAGHRLPRRRHAIQAAERDLQAAFGREEQQRAPGSSPSACSTRCRCRSMSRTRRAAT